MTQLKAEEMTRKTFSTLSAILVVAALNSPLLARTWVSFNSTTPIEPTYSLVSSGVSGVTFDVIIVMLATLSSRSNVSVHQIWANFPSQMDLLLCGMWMMGSTLLTWLLSY